MTVCFSITDSLTETLFPKRPLLISILVFGILFEYIGARHEERKLNQLNFAFKLLGDAAAVAVVTKNGCDPFSFTDISHYSLSVFDSGDSIQKSGTNKPIQESRKPPVRMTCTSICTITNCIVISNTNLPRNQHKARDKKSLCSEI